MEEKASGIVLSAVNYGESDKILNIFTLEQGVVSAKIKGVKKAGAKLRFSAEPFCFAEFTLARRGGMATVAGCAQKESFFGLREDISRLALAQYFCELAGVLAPEESPAEEYLRLMLNALYFLSKNARPPLLLKTVVEMRMMSFSGYMPDLLYCQGCGCYEADTMLFLPRSGHLLCAKCAGALTEEAIPLQRGMLTALRHSIYADFDKLFSFQLSPEGLGQIAKASERYVVHTLQRSFSTLEFYHQMEG